MAVYDGFFDAVLDEETGEYDRAYSSGDFTTYFDKIIGSGVCIHNDPDSFKVRFEGETAVISPGYLFIQGYWLKNDADYSIPVAGASTLAIAAHLNLGKRMIELEAVSVAQAYPDSLVLALVNPAAGTAEDTRYNTDICGVIDTAGELSTKVEWAINYIDNEIEGKLAAAEADIAAQSKRLDAKIVEVQAQVDKITPPPVGTIKFSAAQDVGEEWLLCDGDFISESQYPELVAALGKLTPSNDKFRLISDGEIGPQITNGVIYAGRMWVYSYSAQKLYGIDVEGTEAIKEIPITSEDENFNRFVAPSNAKPIALSIVPSKVGESTQIFISQIVYTGTVRSADDVQIYCANFTGEENSLSMKKPFSAINGNGSIYDKTCIPYVTSTATNGTERYYAMVGNTDLYDNYAMNGFSIRVIEWDEGGESASFKDAAASVPQGAGYDGASPYFNQRAAFSPRNHGEAVMAKITASNGMAPYSIEVVSYPSGLYSRNSFSASSLNKPVGLTSSLPMNLAGANKMLFEYDLTSVSSMSLIETDQPKEVKNNIHLPSAARVFVDAGAYLWGKDIYMIFVGTGIIFSRTLEEGSFGYLDTTGVLGTITQFGYLDYSQDEGTLYLLGQDTTNKVKAAKIVLNTLYDYANDGAWLPVVASDGVPAYIKAVDDGDSGPLVPLSITVKTPNSFDDSIVSVVFNGDELIPGTYTRQLSQGGKFTVGLKAKASGQNASYNVQLTMNGSRIIEWNPMNGSDFGKTKTVSYKVSDFAANGITLQIT